MAHPRGRPRNRRCRLHASSPCSRSASTTNRTDEADPDRVSQRAAADIGPIAPATAHRFRVRVCCRANAGLDTLGARPPGSWDDATGNLRGHYSGHFMSALALAYAGTGDTKYKDKLDYMVTALGQCQDALDATVGQPAPPPTPVE